MIRRHFRIIVIAAAVLAAVIFMHRLSSDNWSRMSDRIMHSLHGPGFAALALLIFWYVRDRWPWPRNYFFAAATAFAVGVLSEASQIPGPRDAEFSDLVVNSIGILSGLGVIALFDPATRYAVGRRYRFTFAVVTLAALAYTLVPTLRLSYAWAQQLRSMPVILEFESAWERQTYSQPRRMRPVLEAAPPNWPVPGSTIARSSEQGRWSIFLAVEPARDWSAYTKLSFIAASDSDSLALAVGIRDMRPDRTTYENKYYERITVNRVPSRYYLSLEDIPVEPGQRPFDLAHVGSLVFSASEPGSNAQLILDDIRLER